jgi:hypothetical protein
MVYHQDEGEKSVSARSSVSFVVAAFSLVCGLVCETHAQAADRYYARQALKVVAGSTSGSQGEPTYTCGIPQQGYVAVYGGVISQPFAAISPEDAQIRCNASRSPAPDMVLNMCVYSSAPSAYGPGLNGIAVWQDASNTDHSRTYSSFSNTFYSSLCVRS